jgi:hypothetical protein
MKAPKLLLILCTAAFAGNAQYNGITLYSNAGNNAILSSGNMTRVHSSGFLLGGYQPNIVAGTMNLFLNKTDEEGIFSNTTTDFQTAYTFDASIPCTSPISQQLNCYGMSAKETSNLLNPAKYIMSAAFDIGFVAAGLDMLGNPLSGFYFPFPAGANQPSRTLITESQSSPGRYYVSGSYFDPATASREMYVIFISNTNMIWSLTYNLGQNTHLEPTAMLENTSASGNVELILVGIADEFTAAQREGFIMSIDAGSGNVSGSQLIGNGPGTNEEFHSIAPGPQADEFVIGGSTDANPGSGDSWMLLFNPFSSAFGPNSQILPSVTNGGPVVGVLHRFSNMFGDQYYGTAISPAGSMVFKLDASGSPFGPSASEFLYNPSAQSFISTPAAITHMDIAGSVNEGIHIYGTDNDSPVGGNFYLTQAYFNGTSGTCSDMPPAIQFTSAINNVIPGPNVVTTVVINATTGLIPCSDFALNVVAIPVPAVQLCPAMGNPMTPYVGDNSRTGVFTGISETGKPVHSVSIHPNPFREVLNIQYNGPDREPVKVELFNNLGQLVLTRDHQPGSGQSNITIDLRGSSLESGIYFIHTTIGQNTDKQKVIYQK